MPVLDFRKHADRPLIALLHSVIPDLAVDVTHEWTMTVAGRDVDDFLPRLLDHVNRTVALHVRQELEARGEVLSGKLRKLQRLADEVEAEVRRQVLRIFPEAVTDEDYR